MFGIFERPAPAYEAGVTSDLTPDQVRQRLAAMPADRRRTTEQHNKQTAPLVARRDRLQAQLPALDDELATMDNATRTTRRTWPRTWRTCTRG